MTVSTKLHNLEPPKFARLYNSDLKKNVFHFDFLRGKEFYKCFSCMKSRRWQVKKTKTKTSPIAKNPNDLASAYICFS